MIKALIFDLDGLLTDTEQVYILAYQAAFKEFGVELSREDYVRLWISEGKAIEDYLLEKGLDLDAHQIRSRRVDHYRRILEQELRTMPFAMEILEHFKGKLPMALATASAEDALVQVLELLDLRSYFDVIISASDVIQSKPDPEMFLKAAEAMGVEPQHCMVLEDARKGILAAKACGMKSIAIPNEYTRDSDLSDATYCCDSLEQAIHLIEKEMKHE